MPIYLSGTGITFPDASIQTTAADIIVGPSLTTASGTTTIIAQNLPGTVSRIHIGFHSFASTVNSDLLVRLGTSAGLQTSGYDSVVLNSASTTTYSTAGLVISGASGTLATKGIMTLVKVDGNTWVSSGVASVDGGGNRAFSGVVPLANLLTQLAVSTLGGTGTLTGKFSVTYD